MCRQFECYNDDCGREHSQANDPHVRVVPVLVQYTWVYAVDAEQKYHNGFQDAFSKPQEVVWVVEDGVLLTDEVDFGKQAEEVLIDLHVFWQVFLLVEDLLGFF